MRKAILVGINNYPDAPLYGCVNDATSFGSLLQARYGFTNDEIIPLYNDVAKKNTIINALTDVANAASAERDSVVLFYYSGHGFSDRFEAGPRVGRTGSYSMICPVDWRTYKMNAILSTDIAAAIKPLRETKTRFIAIFDACESGGLGPWFQALTERPSSRVKSPNPPGGTPLDPPTLGALPPFFTPYDGATSMTACRANEVTFDVNHAPYGSGAGGVFTSFLLHVLNEATPETTMNAIADRVTRALHDGNYDQHPRLLPHVAGELTFPQRWM